MKESQRKMVKVIMATRNNKGKFAYREAMVNQDDAKEFIEKNRG